MEFFRWILVFTGVALLAVAYLMGRKKTKTSVYHRAKPDGYDPSLDELSVPISSPSPTNNWQADSNQSGHESNAGYADSDSYITNESVDAVISADHDYRVDPQAEIEISNEFDDVDLHLDESVDQNDAGKVTSFAGAVKQANADNHAIQSGIDDVAAQQAGDINFSEEFETYGEPVELEDFEEKLVTVHVAASKDRRFYGNDLKVLFDQHGYKFGRMSLYHCSLDGDKVFSIANMVKPGTFDADQMASFETPGITLFMRLPIELDADVAFDFLIREAKELAEELDGHLRDGNRNPLSEQTIQHMREDIQQYVFRNKRVFHTS